MRPLHLGCNVSSYANAELGDVMTGIDKLMAAIDEIYDVGVSGISYVGQANYAEREREARQKFFDAYKRARAALAKVQS